MKNAMLPGANPTLVLFVIALVTASPMFAAQTLDIYFIDCESGNAVLLVTPSNQAMMFDTGQPGEEFVNRILKVLQIAGVKQLDYVVTSHYHWDHYGTIPDLARKIPILNYVDHGQNVEIGRSAEYNERWGGGDGKIFDDYLKAREKGRHIVVKPGDHLPLKGVEVQILTAAGQLLEEPLPGAGTANPACAETQLRSDEESEDSQSVSKLVTYGKFRYADFGDLTWNKSFRLFCPVNMVGTADLYLITHHGLSQDLKAAGYWEWGRASATPAEVHGLHPRVAVLSAREDYIGRVGTPAAWQVARSSPGLEDIWQIHYAGQGGKRNNSPEDYIANLSTTNDQANYIKVSAELDGSFTITNSRNGFTKRYPARQEVKR